MRSKQDYLKKIKTGIEGFDLIAQGGLPKGRTTLVSGTAGSGKTIFAAQFLISGIENSDEGAVFVSFEESPEDIRKNTRGFNWDIARYEKEKKWVFVDASPQEGIESITVGNYDLGALLVRIENAVKKVNAKRISLDSLGAIFSQFTETSIVRSELFRISHALKAMGITAIITAERVNDYGEIARYGIEEFVADNVIIFRNVHEQEKRRRTIEILKFRGTAHQKGEYPFTIMMNSGIIIIPLTAIELKQKSSNVRVSSGNKELDKMCGGGFFRDSIILVSGATGTGKTLMVTEFLTGGFKKNEKCLLFAFEESREQLFRNASSWGVDFKKMEKKGNLKLICAYPETASLEDHLIIIKELIEDFKPDRIAVDSLSALERVSTNKGFLEFIISITSFMKHAEITGFFTSATPTMLRGTSVPEAHLSTITDSIILLRYVEMFGEMRRGLTVLKMRGSVHEKNIREYTIEDDGMHIGKAFRNTMGIISGNPIQVRSSEIKRMGGFFPDDEH